MSQRHNSDLDAPDAAPTSLPRPKHLPLIGSDLPPVVPARMLNEVLYCERLMYLEWVHGEFADNYFGQPPGVSGTS